MIILQFHVVFPDKNRTKVNTLMVSSLYPTMGCDCFCLDHDLFLVTHYVYTVILHELIQNTDFLKMDIKPSFFDFKYIYIIYIYRIIRLRRVHIKPNIKINTRWENVHLVLVIFQKKQNKSTSISNSASIFEYTHTLLSVTLQHMYNSSHYSRVQYLEVDARVLQELYRIMRIHVLAGGINKRGKKQKKKKQKTERR